MKRDGFYPNNQISHIHYPDTKNGFLYHSYVEYLWMGITYKFAYSLTSVQLDVLDSEGWGNVNIAANVVFNHPDWARFLDKDFAITRVVLAVEATATPAPVPESATMLLLGTGLVGIAAVGRKRRKSVKL